MNKEEKEAVEHLKETSKDRMIIPLDDEILIAVNLIEKLQKENAELKNELKEKDKIIDLIAERVFLTEKEWEHMKKRRFLRNDFDLKKEIKNYFENIAKGE